jgi:hypothetical protein
MALDELSDVARRFARYQHTWTGQKFHGSAVPDPARNTLSNGLHPWLSNSITPRFLQHNSTAMLSVNPMDGCRCQARALTLPQAEKTHY